MNIVKIEDQVESEVQRTGWWLCTEPDDENCDSLMEVSEMDDDQLLKASVLLNCSPQLLREVNSHLDSLREATHNELAHLYMTMRNLNTA